MSSWANSIGLAGAAGAAGATGPQGATGVAGAAGATGPAGGGGSASGVSGLIQWSNGASGFASDYNLKWDNSSKHVILSGGSSTITEDHAILSLNAGTPGNGDAAGDRPMMSMRNGNSSEFGFDVLINNNVTGDFLIKRVASDVASEAFRIARDTGIITMAAYGAGAATFSAAGVISSASDERLKDIKGYFTKGLAALEGLKPITYKWNEASGMLPDEHEYSGFSAQNVSDNIPEGVGQDQRGYMSLQDRALMATMVNAIKELSARVKELESKA